MGLPLSAAGPRDHGPCGHNRPCCFLCRSLSFLVKLEQLDLGGNDLEVLVWRGWGSRGWGGARQGSEPWPPPCPHLFLQPDTLGALPNLRELWLDRNQLSALPPVSEGVAATPPWACPSP